MKTPNSLTRAELAERWGRSQRLLRKWESEGAPMPRRAEFLGQRPVRYLLSEVERFEKEQGLGGRREKTRES